MMIQLLMILLSLLAGASAAHADSYYNHNGSIMRVVEQGNWLRIIYEQPRPGLVSIGLRPGTLLLEGQFDGGLYLDGMTRIFSERCREVDYYVYCQYQRDGDFTLSGAAPVLESDGCRIVDNIYDGDNANLFFAWLRSDRGGLPATSPPATVQASGLGPFCVTGMASTLNLRAGRGPCRYWQPSREYLWRHRAPPLLAWPTGVVAQSDPAPDLMIVLDGSGSMWGQIDGRSKIEIARETLSGVLSEAAPDQNIGMIFYGHRVRGQCSDIELAVVPGPAAQIVPQIIEAANRLNPTGMTPLSDSVRQAAEQLRFTERAATVVLITDGIETCNADPCALGRDLARMGLDFTAHVVGFGMDEEEGAQVACLAENTGGQFFLANDAQALSDALAQTLVSAEDFLPEPSDFLPDADAAPRDVQFILRGTDGGEPLRHAGHLTLTLTPADPSVQVAPPELPAASQRHPWSAVATLPPGAYTALAGFRIGDGRSNVSVPFEFTIVSGEGAHIVDVTLAAALRIVPLLTPGQPF